MQAIIITAYKDPEMLYRICEKFNKDGYRIFIHIDRRYAGNFDIKRIRAYKRTEVYSKYAISWGSIKHLYAIIALMKRALRYDDVKYLHIISGQDYPVSSIDQAENNGHIYMSLAPVPEERYQQYNYCQKLDQRNPYVERLYRGSVKLQKAAGIKREYLGRYNEIYKGNIWSSMPRAAAEYALKEAKADNGSFLKDLYTTYIPEEFFFQTIFMNSPEWNLKVIRNNMRYNDWQERDNDPSVPVILDERDFDAVRYSGAWFARKMDSAKSYHLIKKLEGGKIEEKGMVSVIITTCQREMPVLERALKSAYNQTYKNKEIIVVNDYPPYKEDIERLLLGYPGVRFATNVKQSGACVARNLGIYESRGKYIALLDDDDEWFPEKLEKEIRAFREDTVLVYCDQKAILQGRELKSDPARAFPEGDVREEILASNFVGGCSVPVFRRDAVVRCGGFDTDLMSSQDLDLWIRLSGEGSFSAVREKLMIYSVGGSSITGNFEKRMQGWEAMLDKYGDQYKKHPESRAAFTSVMVREAAKRAPLDKSLRVLARYGSPMEYGKGIIMRLLKIY